MTYHNNKQKVSSNSIYIVSTSLFHRTICSYVCSMLTERGSVLF